MRKIRKIKYSRLFIIIIFAYILLQITINIIGNNIETLVIESETIELKVRAKGLVIRDEYLIKSLIEQDAKIDLFGVGENLITAKSEPVFGGVYKLVALEKDKKIVPKIKVSENTAKVTNPSFKKVYRFYDNETKKAIADVITLADEILDEREYMIFDPQNPWKKKILKDYSIRLLQEKIFEERKINL